MKVYKFGGASVRSAAGVRNLAHILSLSEGQMFVVISAMGKTTNALEEVLEHYMQSERAQAFEKLEAIKTFHLEIIGQLFAEARTGEEAIEPVFAELQAILSAPIDAEYDKAYDRIVSCGELISTRIISAYLNECGIPNKWLDMRHILQTDSNFREANIYMEESAERLKQAIDQQPATIYIGQGFIGGNTQGHPTTLGREGSDYTAAVVANLLNAESVTIWKDVPGILNADPRIFPDTIHIPELTYYDAVELAYSGAQVIHPKTIKPLENKHIPLFVKPFENPEASGSVIKASTEHPIDVPVLILRKNQILITVRPRDFSFVLEDGLSTMFNILHKHRLKISLIQSSAVTISVCVDNTRYVEGALSELHNKFRVTYNDQLELLTIRGVTPEIIARTTGNKEILLMQKTRRTARFLMKSQPQII